MIHNINISFSNCGFDKPYHIEESDDSEIHLTIGMDQIVSGQSRGKTIEQLEKQIQKELSRISWLIYGDVFIDISWYFSCKEKRATDKVGDLDNITKPLLDSFCGPDGFMIDDCQVKGLYTCWRSKFPEGSALDTVQVDVRFSNSECLSKRNLVFVPVKEPLYVAIDESSAIVQKIFSESERRKIGFIDSYPSIPYEIVDKGVFHKTRIQAFRSKIL